MTTKTRKPKTKRRGKPGRARLAPPAPEVKAPTGRLMYIPLGQIDEPIPNHRMDGDRGVETLAASIRDVGLLQPIRVYYDRDPTLPETSVRPAKGERFRLAFGHRRLAAVQSLKHTEIAAFVSPASQWQLVEVQVQRAVENLQRSDLSPAEEALAVQALVDDLVEASGGRQGQAAIEERAAERIGRQVRWVRERMRLRRLDPKVQQLLYDGKILVGHAIELSRLGDQTMQRRLARGIAWSAVGEDRYCTTIEDVRDQVEREIHSLKGVRWRLDTKVGPLPACDRCPHNSNNQVDLFTGLGEDPIPDKCLKPSCYRQKVKRADAELQRAATAIVDEKASPTVTTARRVAKGFMKAESVARLAKRLVPQGKKGKAKAGAPRGRVGEQRTAQTKYRQAFHVWSVKRDKATAKEVLSRPQLAAAAWLLQLHPAVEALEYSNPADDGTPPDKNELKALEVFRRLMQGLPSEPGPDWFAFTAEQIASVPKNAPYLARWGNNPQYSRVFDQMPPVLIERLAELLGIDVGKRPDPGAYGLEASP